MRLFAPSETKAARIQLGSGRFKTDDRDCAALTYLARQGAGRLHTEECGGCAACCDAPPARVGRRPESGPATTARSAQRIVPRLSAPAGHGRSLPVASPTGLAVLTCAAAFDGRAPRMRSLITRAPGRMTAATAHYRVDRWRGCLPPPADAQRRARRLARDLDRYQRMQADIAVLDEEVAELQAGTGGQILTTLPGVAVIRSAEFAAHNLPIRRFPDAEQPVLCDRPGACALPVGDLTSLRPDLPPGSGRTPRCTDGMAWGLSQSSPCFAQRYGELKARGMAPPRPASR